MLCSCQGLPGGASGKEPSCQCRRHSAGSIPTSGVYARVGHGKPFQYSCLKNPMDRGTWQATVRSVSKSWTQLSDLASTHA